MAKKLPVFDCGGPTCNNKVQLPDSAYRSWLRKERVSLYCRDCGGVTVVQEYETKEHSFAPDHD